MKPLAAFYDKKSERFRIYLDIPDARILIYALRIFCDEMKEAGDTRALQYAEQMEDLRKQIIRQQSDLS